jgi:hypothetical protein
VEAARAETEVGACCLEIWDLMAEIRRKAAVGEMRLEPGYDA